MYSFASALDDRMAFLARQLVKLETRPESYVPRSVRCGLLQGLGFRKQLADQPCKILMSSFCALKSLCGVLCGLRGLCSKGVGAAGRVGGQAGMRLTCRVCWCGLRPLAAGYAGPQHVPLSKQ